MNREIYKKIREFSVDMYTKGYEEGFEDGKKDSCEIEKAKEFSNDVNHAWQYAYERGLKDAWDAARTITNYMTVEELESCELSVKGCYNENEYSCRVLGRYSASEVIDKLKGHTTKPDQTAIRDCKTCKNSRDGKIAYTETCHECIFDSKYENNDDEVRVGDEVIIHENDKCIVISTIYGGFNVLSEDGRWGSLIYNKNDITKTGRHFSFSQITEMFDQMKEENKE